MMTAQYQAALHSYAEGRYEEAMQQFSELLYEDPRNPKLHIWLGACFRKVGKIEYAKVQYQQVLTLTDDPDLLDLASTSLAQIQNKLLYTSSESNSPNTSSESNSPNTSPESNSPNTSSESNSPKAAPKATVHRHKATNQFYDEKLDATTHLRMMQIPAGTFLMGSPESEERRSTRESPQHQVSVPSFFMAKYPVTQAQWRIVAKMPQVKLKLEPNPSKFKGDTRPVERVSWHEAIEFCARLTKHTKRQYRLPTESEWEYACRAGTTTPFHFGEIISPELANYNSKQVYGDGVTGKYQGEPTPIDHFKITNAWGLCDMHGNVWEWCQDHWHSNYKGAPEDGSAWLIDESNAPRVWRGGSWLDDPIICRSAYRESYTPVGRYDYLGFRVSCSAPATL